MKYAVWKHYHQHASTQQDEIFLGHGVAKDTAVTTALELFDDVNPDDERSYDELKSLIESDEALDTGDFSLILMSDQHTGEGTFELINGAASQTSERSVQYCPF